MSPRPTLLVRCDVCTAGVDAQGAANLSAVVGCSSLSPLCPRPYFWGLRRALVVPAEPVEAGRSSEPRRMYGGMRRASARDPPAEGTPGEWLSGRRVTCVAVVGLQVPGGGGGDGGGGRWWRYLLGRYVRGGGTRWPAAAMMVVWQQRGEVTDASGRNGPDAPEPTR